MRTVCWIAMTKSAASGNAVVTPTTQFNTITGASGCAPLSATCVVSSRIQNFTRVEVFGSPDVAWVRVTIDPFDPNVAGTNAQMA